MIDYGTTFLLWSYFGISLEEIEESGETAYEQVIDAAILRAYRDASSHVLSVKERYKEKLKKAAVSDIKDFVLELKEVFSQDKSLTGEEKQAKYDELHEAICEKLVGLYDNDEYYGIDKNGKKHKFTYGIAQKWVNMSMKYTYLLEELLADVLQIHWVHYFATDLHVPFDSYIFKALKVELEIEADEHLNVENWSHIENYENYKSLQNKIRDKLRERNDGNSISPIEWENTAWIRVCLKGK